MIKSENYIKKVPVMKLYLVNAENIYFPQIKEYFREIVSSYDNGNYRSAMVMLYSTIVYF